MRLEKWYADVVDDGRMSVHYRAALSLGPFNLAYCGELSHAKPRRGAFTPGICRSLPRICALDAESALDAARLLLTTDGGPLAWRNAMSRPVCLWTDGRRHVTWDPLVLNGVVEGVMHGRGYAEKLVMNVAPWRLVIDRLWWGRFCGDRHSFVWIVWEGRNPLRLSLFDGRQLRLDAVSEEAVCAEASLRLRLGERRLLVDSALAAGALADMPWPKRIAPVSFLSGRERKWLAQGELQLGGQKIDRGAVICETVEWP